MLGEPNQLIVTKSGHYIIPINPLKAILNHVTTGINTNVALSTTENSKWKIDIALKLQQQFAHPSPGTLLRLLNSAGNVWETDKEFRKLIRKLNEECIVCKVCVNKDMLFHDGKS